jgi:hypothetical protein
VTWLTYSDDDVRVAIGNSKLRNIAKGEQHSAPLPRAAYTTDRDKKTSRRSMISSILLMMSSIDLVSAGVITSKQQSHFGQCQR